MWIGRCRPSTIAPHSPPRRPATSAICSGTIGKKPASSAWIGGSHRPDLSNPVNSAFWERSRHTTFAERARMQARLQQRPSRGFSGAVLRRLGHHTNAITSKCDAEGWNEGNTHHQRQPLLCSNWFANLWRNFLPTRPLENLLWHPGYFATSWQSTRDRGPARLGIQRQQARQANDGPGCCNSRRRSSGGHLRSVDGFGRDRKVQCRLLIARPGQTHQETRNGRNRGGMLENIDESGEKFGRPRDTRLVHTGRWAEQYSAGPSFVDKLKIFGCCAFS